MSAPGTPPSTPGSASRRRASYVHPNLRVSDAERAEAADRLAKHYGDGRLDQAAFDERLDRAMNAKTQADLTGLFTDLPGAQAPEVPQAPQAAARQHDRHPRRRRLGSLVLVVVITAVVGHALTRWYIPWLLIGLLVFGWLSYGPRRHGRR